MVAAVLTTVLVMCGACEGSGPPLPARNPHVDPAEIARYVALGDSFSAGPAISPEQSGAGICQRSERNYPSLLADQLDVSDFRDVSCAGATTDHVLRDTPASGLQAIPAQADALSKKTGLVTIGIGYNNDGIFGRLYGACLPSSEVGAGTCQSFVAERFRSLLGPERRDVVEALKEIRRRAPHATVVLVGYLPILPESDACPAPVFSEQNQRTAHDAEASIDDNLRAAAAQAGTEFVSMRDLARGHGVCDGEAAWVNGAEARQGDGAVFHPRATGMKAVAEAIATDLQSNHS